MTLAFTAAAVRSLRQMPRAEARALVAALERCEASASPAPTAAGRRQGCPSASRRRWRAVITIDDRGLQVLACARDATMGAPVAESSPGDELVPLHAVQRLLAGESPVRIWRLHRGLTQTQLARAAKLTQSMVAKLEAGEKTPSLPSLKALAAALGVDLDDIA